MKNKRINKKNFKHSEGKCRICGETNYNLLDVHRIIPGSKNGKYNKENSVTICANCHRKIHANEIKIDRYYQSTNGFLLRIIENEKERFI
jgi:5-methylcytosine-specific restriction endonuclease McrA